jgi:CHAD domain-containing protein
MPDANPIPGHWQTQLQVFDHNFSLLQHEMNVDAIHDLRVAIKKLRSYLKLYSTLFEKKQHEELLGILRAVFSVFGKHRNIDIVKEIMPSLAEKNKPIPKTLLVYLQLLQDQVNPYCRQTIQEFKKDEFDKLTREVQQELENSDAAELQGKVKELITSMTKEIRKDLKHFKKESHLIRKQLKDIFYWSNIFDDQVVFTKQQLKTLDRGLDHLGNIQDIEVLITHLKNFRKTILSNSSAEYHLIKRMEAKAEKRQDALLEKAHRITENVIFVDKI